MEQTVEDLEQILPVIRLKRERKDESRPVEEELLRMPAKITTGKLNFGLVQLEPVEAKKRLPIQLRVALYSKGVDAGQAAEPKTAARTRVGKDLVHA